MSHSKEIEKRRSCECDGEKEWQQTEFLSIWPKKKYYFYLQKIFLFERDRITSKDALMYCITLNSIRNTRDIWLDLQSNEMDYHFREFHGSTV